MQLCSKFGYYTRAGAILMKQETTGMQGMVLEAQVCCRESTVGPGIGIGISKAQFITSMLQATGLTVTWGNKALPRPAEDGDVACEYMCTPGKGIGEVSTVSIDGGAATRQDLHSPCSLHPNFAYDTV